MVVVIVAILAAMTIPRSRNTKGKAHAAALRTDLRNLASAEEAFFAANSHYTADIDSLNFRGSPGVIVTIPEATIRGWSASVTHPESFPLTCALYEGSVAPLPPATSESQVTCQ